jgi:DNA-binding CsgD family transcriptional regulator
VRSIRAANLEPQQENNHSAHPHEAHQAEVTIAGQPRVVLTPHEKQVVRLLAMGKTNKDISPILAISTRTVEAHRSPVYVIKATVKPPGNGDFPRRMTQFAEVFERAAGEKLYPGTLNVKVDRPVRWKEDFRIKGVEIDEPGQDLIFEYCQINGLKAYRIRPYNLTTGGGGWGDDTLEIASECCLKDRLGLDAGCVVEITLFGDAADF